MKRNLFLIIVLSILIFASCGSDTENSTSDIYDTIVVGAGGGGLSAASQLARAGKKVHIIEQHSRVGGYMTNFKRGDFMFEISLHAMDNLNPGRMSTKLFENLGIAEKIKSIKLDPMYRLNFPDFNVDVPSDPEKYKMLLIANFPHEKEGIDDFYVAVNQIDRAMNVGLKFHLGDYLSGLWGFIKQPWVFVPLLSNLNSSIDDFLDNYFKDKNLIGVIASLAGFLGAKPENISGIAFASMWTGYHIGGYHYIEGGSQSITDALEELIRKNGGEILLSTRVTKILVEEGKAVGVRTKDGKTFKSRYVVSNANALDTFFKLIGEEHLPKDYLENLKNMKIGPATFTLYLGLNKDYSKYFPRNVHGFNVFPSTDLIENYKPIVEGDIDRVPFGIVNYTMVDPTNAPKGKNAIVCVTFMPYDFNNGWKENESYEKYTQFKNKLAKMFLKRIEKYLPDVTSHIEVMEIGTPRTNVHYTSNTEGSIIGWANTVEQSMMNRLPQETPIDNLFLSGAWTFPGGGQSAVLLSGWTTANMVLDDLGR